MYGNEHEVLAQALGWRQSGHRTVLATVLATYGASPRPPGSMAVISERGLISGSVSGGCVEDDLVHEVVAGHFWRPDAERVALRTYGRDAAERERYRLPCGHALRLAIEPFWPTMPVQAAVQAMAARRLVMRRLDYATGEVHITQDVSGVPFEDDAQGLRQVLGPRHRLLLIGATEVSRYLVPIAATLGYAVTVCDPREEYLGAWPAGLPCDLITAMPDDAVRQFHCDERTAVITVTHDPKQDDLALIEALPSRAFYVGALGSSVNTARRKARLREFDVSEAQLAALHGPVGLPIGSRSPAEIAVSIAAELVQVRR